MTVGFEFHAYMALVVAILAATRWVVAPELMDPNKMSFGLIPLKGIFDLAGTQMRGEIQNSIAYIQYKN